VAQIFLLGKQKLNEMKKYTGFIFAMLVGFFATATTYYTVPTTSWPNVGWSLTPNGAPCNCGPNMNANNNNFTDTLVITQDVSIPNLELESGALVIVQSGATFSGAWSWMKVENGAKIQLEAGSVLDPNVDFELDGEITGVGTIETGWGFEVKSSGLINLSSGSFIDANDFEIDGTVTIDGNISFSNDDWTIDGSLTVINGNFTKTGGDLKVDGTIVFDGNLFDIQGDLRVRNNGVVNITADTVTFVSGDFTVEEDLNITAHYTSITSGDLDVKNNAVLVIDSKLYLSNMDIMNHELFMVTDSVWMYGLSFETKNNSITQFDGYVFGATTAGLEYKGDIIIGDVMDLELWFDLDDNGGEITGCGLIDFNATQPWQLPASSLQINGVNTPLSYVTFLGANGSSCASNAVWFYEGTWSTSSTSCADEAIIMSNLDMNAPQSFGRMKVKKGVKVQVKNGATITVCQDIVNNGFIRVEAGGSLIVQGN